MEEQPAPPAEAPKPAPKGKALWIAVAVVVVVVVVLLAAVFGGLFGPPEETVLKVGTVLAITGGLSAFGPKNLQGVQMAIAEINDAGGVLGRPIQEFDQDSGTDPDIGAAAARTLISQNRVDAIIGATGSGICSTVVEVAKANGVLEISGSCTSPKFSDQSLTNGWFVRTAPSDALQGVVAASYAYTNLTLAKGATIAINNAYGSGLANVFATNFTRLGGELVAPVRLVTEVQFGATSYTTDLEAIIGDGVANPPEFIYLVAYPPDGILMMQNWEQGKGTHGPQWDNVFWLFSEGVFDQTKFLNVLKDPPNSFDTSRYEGTAPSAFGGVTGPEYADWAAAYETRWGEAPGLFDDNNYDAAYLIALAAQKAGTATGQAIKDNIRSVANPPGTKIFPGEWSKALTEIAAGRDIDYEGASGAVNLDEFGDPLSAYIVWGVDAAGVAFNKEVFPESLVTSLLPAPPAQMQASSVSAQFVEGLVARSQER